MSFKHSQIILFLLTVYSLVACQPNQQNTGGSSPSNTNPIARNTVTSGPIDSGGENLINGVALESYRTNIIEELEEFKLIQPILHSMSVAYSFDFRNFIKIKNWYMIPASLSDLSNKAVGVDLKEGSTQTVALQGQNEIWIDKNLYDKQSPNEKAKILLHEFVRTLNGIKYISINDMCKTWMRAGNECHAHQKTYQNMLAMQPLTKPALDEAGLVQRGQDTEAIRSMTLWLWQNKEALNSEDIMKRLETYDYDKRYFAAGERLIWPAEYIRLSDTEFDGLLDQILNANETLTAGSTMFGIPLPESKPSSQLIINVDFEIPEESNIPEGLLFQSGPVGCYLNMVKKNLKLTPNMHLPDSHDPQYKKMKGCLYQNFNNELFQEKNKLQIDEHNLPIMKNNILQKIYTNKGATAVFMLKFFENIDSIPAITPTKNDSSKIVSSLHMLQKVAFFNFLLNEKSTSKSKAEKLILNSIKFYYFENSLSSIRGVDSADKLYSEKTILDEQSVYCIRNVSISRVNDTTHLSGYRNSYDFRLDLVMELNKPNSFTNWISTLNRVDFFQPTCEIRKASDLYQSKRKPKRERSLFSTLTNNSDMFVGNVFFSNIDKLDRCENSPPEILQPNDCIPYEDELLKSAPNSEQSDAP